MAGMLYPPKYQQKITDNVCVADILFLTLHCQNNGKVSIVSFLVTRSSDLYNSFTNKKDL